jgi:VIT1/CCC1 family predicted Fe2+/Mn2+ transporter
MGALAVCLLVILITLPVAIPFMFMDSVAYAMRASNAVAIALLFLCGTGFGRLAGYRPLPSGFIMVLLGVVIVVFTIALGG